MSPFLLAAVCWASIADARPSAKLVFVRAEGAEVCPNEEAVRAAVATRLGYDPFVAYGKKTLFARVQRENDGFRTELRVIDDDGIERGTRELFTPGADCSQSIAAMALTISIAVDPLSVMRDTAPAPPPARESPTPIALESPPESADEKPIAPARSEDLPPAAAPAESARASPVARVLPFVGIGVGGTLGRAPTASASGSIFAGARWRSVSLALEGRGDLPTSTSSSEGGRISSHAWLGSVVACGYLGAPYACAIAGSGAVLATSSGVSGPRADETFLAFAGVRVGLVFPLGARLELHAYTDGVALLRPYRFTMNGVEVYSSPPVSADANFALAVRFE